MTDIEQKALALVNEVQRERQARNWLELPRREMASCEALCRTIEQHEAFRREVSDAVEEWGERWIGAGAGESHSYFMSLFSRFILPAPVDPLVEALREAIGDSDTEQYERDANALRAAMKARGLRIVEVE